MVTFIDLFAGIGGFHSGLTKAGMECVGWCEQDKYAQESYRALYPTDNLWFSPDVRALNGTEMPYADLWCFGFPCFTAGTLVKTSQGLTPIEEINNGDLVLTKELRYKPVIQTMRREVSEVYNIKACGTEGFTTTAEHPFWVRHRRRVWNNKKRSYGRVFDAPLWVKTKDLTKDYYFGIPVEQIEKPLEWDGITFERRGKEYLLNNLPLDNHAFYWFIGRWLADGWTTEIFCSNKNTYKAILCCGKHKVEDTEKHLKSLGLHYTKAEERTVYKFIFSNKELFCFLRRYGVGASNKFIHQEILQLPVEFLKDVLDGYMSGDGSFNGKLYKATSVSRKLIYGLAACVNKVYHRNCAIYKSKRPSKYVIEGRIVNQRDTYILSYKIQNDKQDNAFYEDGFIWVPINRIEKENKLTTVYNIGVEDDESYTANAICCHNCQDVSIAGLKDGMGNTRSGLFYEVTRLLHETKHKPKWLLIENVKNLLSIDNGWGFYGVLSEMDKAGYSIAWRVYNTKDFGLPQNRERLFIIGHLGNECPSEVLYRPNQSEQSIVRLGNLLRTESFGGNPQRGRVYSPDGLSPTVTCIKGGGQEPKILLSRNPNVIRKLTPREFWRLQGFTDEQFNRVRPIQSDAQLYKQAGNSVSIPIVYELGKNIIEHHRRLHDSE